jgi:protein deglycase
MARALLPLAAGFEELEAVTIIDVLRRAGIEVVVAAAARAPVEGSHGIRITPDERLAELAGAFDLIVLPGGMPGAEHLAADAALGARLKAHAAAGRLIGAICAAPVVLARAGLLAGRCATAYPGFLEREGVPGLTLSPDPVVIDGRIVTSRGPGTALDFALTLVELLEGRAARAATEARLERPRAAA